MAQVLKNKKRVYVDIHELVHRFLKLRALNQGVHMNEYLESLILSDYEKFQEAEGHGKKTRRKAG